MHDKKIASRSEQSGNKEGAKTLKGTVEEDRGDLECEQMESYIFVKGNDMLKSDVLAIVFLWQNLFE